MVWGDVISYQTDQHATRRILVKQGIIKLYKPHAFNIFLGYPPNSLFIAYFKSGNPPIENQYLSAQFFWYLKR